MNRGNLLPFPGTSVLCAQCTAHPPLRGKQEELGEGAPLGVLQHRKMGLDAGPGGRGQEEEPRLGSAVAISYVGEQNPPSVTTTASFSPAFPQPRPSGEMFRTRQGVPTSSPTPPSGLTQTWSQARDRVALQAGQCIFSSVPLSNHREACCGPTQALSARLVSRVTYVL